jgi:prepilin-type N-terminal cleavage/methylation domain-containing protein
MTLRSPGLRGGYSLVEILIVLVVLGILFTIASPVRRKAADQARHAVARANMRNVLFAQMSYLAVHDVFTNDISELLNIEPALQLHDNNGGPGSVYMVVGQPGRTPSICLFAEGSKGEWHTLYYSNLSGGAVGLDSPNDCTRRMLDEETGQNPPEAPDWLEPRQGDSTAGPVVMPPGQKKGG